MIHEIRREYLYSSLIDPRLHLPIRDRATLVGLFETSLNHQMEGKLTNNFIVRAIVWQLLYKLSDLFFRCCHVVRILAQSIQTGKYRHAHGGVGHSESWRAGAVVGVCSRPNVVIRITEPMITAAAINISRVSGSLAMSQPKNTATTGFTKA